MDSNNGWIKLHRKLLDNPVVMKDSDHLAVWIYLLLNASHTEYPVLFGGKKISLKAGQLITGRKSIASTLNMSESKVTRVIEMLKSEHQIEQQTSNKNRLITIVNWELYQQSEQQIEQQVNNNRTTSEQQVNTNKNNKNIKNIKECKEIIYSDVPELNEAIIAFIDYRKSIKKPMSDRAITLLIGKLKKMSNSVQEQIEILNQSILNGWQGIFPLKNDSGSGKKASFQGRNYDFDELEKKLIGKSD